MVNNIIKKLFLFFAFAYCINIQASLSNAAKSAVDKLEAFSALVNEKLEPARFGGIRFGARGIQFGIEGTSFDFFKDKSSSSQSLKSGIYKRLGISFAKDLGRMFLGPVYQNAEDYYNQNFLNNNRPGWWTTWLWDAPEVKTEEQIQEDLQEELEELVELKVQEKANAQHIIDYKYTPLTPPFSINTPVAQFENVALTRYDLASTGVYSAKMLSKFLLFKSVLSARNDFLTDCILENSRSLENILKEHKAIGSSNKLSGQIFNKMLSEFNHFNYILPVNILRNCAFDIFANYVFDAYSEKINFKLLASASAVLQVGKPNITNFGTVFNTFTSFRTYLLYFIKKNKYLNDLILDSSDAFTISKDGVSQEWQKITTKDDTFIAESFRAGEEYIQKYWTRKNWIPKLVNIISGLSPLNLIKQKVGHGDKIDSAINLANTYFMYLFLCRMVDSFAAFNWQKYVFENSDILLDLMVKYNFALDSANQEDIEIYKNLISIFVVDGNKLEFTFRKVYDFLKSSILAGSKVGWLKQFKYQALLVSITALLYRKQTLGLMKSIGSYFVSKKVFNNFFGIISLD